MNIMCISPSLNGTGIFIYNESLNRIDLAYTVKFTPKQKNKFVKEYLIKTKYMKKSDFDGMKIQDIQKIKSSLPKSINQKLDKKWSEYRYNIVFNYLLLKGKDKKVDLIICEGQFSKKLNNLEKLVVNVSKELGVKLVKYANKNWKKKISMNPDLSKEALFNILYQKIGVLVERMDDNQQQASGLLLAYNIDR